MRLASANSGDNRCLFWCEAEPNNKVVARSFSDDRKIGNRSTLDFVRMSFHVVAARCEFARNPLLGLFELLGFAREIAFANVDCQMTEVAT